MLVIFSFVVFLGHIFKGRSLKLLSDIKPVCGAEEVGDRWVSAWSVTLHSASAQRCHTTTIPQHPWAQREAISLQHHALSSQPSIHYSSKTLCNTSLQIEQSIRYASNNQPGRWKTKRHISQAGNYSMLLSHAGSFPSLSSVMSLVGCLLRHEPFVILIGRV